MEGHRHKARCARQGLKASQVFAAEGGGGVEGGGGER